MFGLSWLSPTLIGAVGIALFASLGGAWTAHKLDAGPLAQAKAATAAIDSSYSQYKASVAASVAAANAKALSDKQAQDAHANALQQQLIEQQKANDAKNKSLQALLAAAKPGDVRAIGPTALSYYDRLRQPQASGTAAPAGNP